MSTIRRSALLLAPIVALTAELQPPPETTSDDTMRGQPAMRCTPDERPMTASVDCDDGAWCDEGRCVDLNCRFGTNDLGACLRPFGDQCTWTTVGGARDHDCLGSCIGGRCRELEQL